MFDTVKKLVEVTSKKALNEATGVPIHSLIKIEGGDNRVQYVHVEALHNFFFGKAQ
tara:strand:+ start:522 stop:689 length:168 start_codon:yes stop_codon:yes gene_type:complete